MPAVPDPILPSQWSPRPDPRARAILERAPDVTAAAVGVVALAVLVLGWGAGLEMVARLLPGFVTMKVNTALGFLLAAVSLWLASREGPGARQAGRLAAALLVLLGAATMAQYLFSIDLGIDQLIVRDPAEHPFPGRPAPSTALGFLLAGVVLLRPGRDTGPALWLRAALVLLLGAMSYLALVGYALGVESLYTVQAYTSIALPSALLFLFLTLGLAALERESRLVRTARASTADGQALRLLLPAVIVVPFVIGWLLHLGVEADLFEPFFALSLFVVASAGALLAVILRTVGRVGHVERARMEAMRALHDEAQWFRITLGSVADGVLATDHRGRMIFMNDAAVSLTGWDRKQARGRRVQEVFRIFAEETGEAVPGPVAEVLATGEPAGLSGHVVLERRDGSRMPIDDTAAPIRGPDEGLIGTVLVFRDVTYRREAERALRQSAEQKDRFLAMLGHELRNPLAAMRTATELLRHTDQDDGRRIDRSVAVLDRQSRHMSRVIDDLLDVSRIARGKLNLRPERVDLRRLLTEVVLDHARTAEQRGLRLELRDDEQTPVWLEADPTRLYQVFDNLLTNALKFTNPPGEVRVELVRRGASVEVTVQDTGIGLPPEQLATVFEVFQQTEQTVDQPAGGLGLGLSVVKGIAELHGGSVEARSEGPGRGARFTVRLPAKVRETERRPEAR